jgi:hypothetical protein
LIRAQGCGQTRGDARQRSVTSQMNCCSQALPPLLTMYLQMSYRCVQPKPAVGGARGQVGL